VIGIFFNYKNFYKKKRFYILLIKKKKKKKKKKNFLLIIYVGLLSLLVIRIKKRKYNLIIKL